MQRRTFLTLLSLGAAAPPLVVSTTKPVPSPESVVVDVKGDHLAEHLEAVMKQIMIEIENSGVELILS